MTHNHSVLDLCGCEFLTMPQRLPPPPHVFGDARAMPATAMRHAQTERTCATCGAVKVTVHGVNGQHWREWRRSADGVQEVLGVGPRCVVVGEKKA